MANLSEPASVDGTLCVDVRRSADGLILVVGGELDVANCDEVRRALDGLDREEARWIIIDLSPLAFTDSSGLALFVRAYKRSCASERWFAIACPGDGIRKLFRVTGLIDVLHVLDTLEDARAFVTSAQSAA
jgi:anti-anti-sigma factor